MIDISETEFQELVEQSVAAIPERFASHLQNVAFLVADDAAPDQRRRGGALHGRTLLLGLYEGIPLPRRDSGYSGVTPDTITIFRRPHQLLARDRQELARMVHQTVWHEVAHYFGLDHGAIRALER